jgi:3D-(3,5/4)-trihydroxycyclohexane-1,2-dione acylhydrolase (decyclizing)
METIRLTMAQALVRWLVAQRVEAEGRPSGQEPLFAGVFAIFGHGNVTCLGEALHEAGDALPTWRGQNEAGMAMAAAAFAKHARRRRIMVATSSIGPGAANMVTAAGVAHANRLPLLLLAGDVFASRLPDPVLQQVEHFGDPTATVNDAFRAVTRYWDRITRPEQILASLPQALATMLDPGGCGPAFLGLCQDVQAEAYDYPVAFFEPRVNAVPRPRADAGQLEAAAAALRSSSRPLLVAGGGVHYSGACERLAAFAQRRGLPVVETVAGRTALRWDHPRNAGPIGVTGSTSANALAAETDLVLAVGTRLQDFTTGSWTVFGQDDLRIVAVNAARFDAVKHLALPVVGDALVAIEELDGLLGDWRAHGSWTERASAEHAQWQALVDEATAPGGGGPGGGSEGGGSEGAGAPPSYAQVIGAVNRAIAPDDVVLTAAGGLPGELNKVWRARTVGAFDVDYGFSCMGYEVSGAWGAAFARPEVDVVALVGDGSYLMLPSDVYSTVLSGRKVIYVLCDNGGYAVIDRLQRHAGGAPFNNLLAGSRRPDPGSPTPEVDFVAHAASMGAIAERVATTAELEDALRRAKLADRTTVIVIRTDPDAWTGGDAWWETGVPEVSGREQVRAARAEWERAALRQRRGV